MDKILYITGEITPESYNEFSRKVRLLEVKGVKRVVLEIISEGGDAYSALAYFDRIQSSQIEFVGIATGLVASAATLIFIGCEQRYMTNSAWLMIHEDSLSGLDNSKVSQLERETKHARRMEDQWSSLFAFCTKVTKLKWDALAKTETYMDADECYKLGILDGIVE